MTKLLGCAVLPLLFVIACKGKEQSKPVESSAGAIASDADYESKMAAMFGQMITIFTNAGSDCDKLASTFSTYLGENRALMHSLRDYGKAHPDAVTANKEKLAPRTGELGSAMQPALTSCKEHKGLDAVMAEFKKDMEGS
jgi:hypothetical protein